MSTLDHETSLETQIDQWRSYLRRRQAIHAVDVAELEDHLREQVATLIAAGLSPDEAFLVAVKRIGDLDALSREFAHEHSERLWKHLVVAATDGAAPLAANRRDAMVALLLALAAALMIKLPVLFGMQLEQDAGFYARNAGVLVLPCLAIYFVWKRQLGARTLLWLAAAFALAALFANVYPFAPNAMTEILVVLHLPIALWLAVGIVYAGGRWHEGGGRMDFIRFSGELFIYYVLIALGGGVLTAFVLMMFEAIGIKAEDLFAQWLPSCAAGAVLVAAWLVEAKQSVIENMAPVLTRLFSPILAVVLVVFLATVLWTGRGIDIDRNVLIAFDLLLVLVLGLLLYSVSARDPQAPPGVFDAVQVVLLICALLADALALWAITARINEFGFTPNRVAALGENVILLVNLTWSAALYIRFLRGRGSFARLERWQTVYLPVYASWAAIVVIVFPPLFRYI
ncbi:MAG: permease prefix domain 1-containing protein [Rhodanobacter sp.]